MQTRTRKIVGVLGAVAACASVTTAAISQTGATASPPVPLITKLPDLVRAEAVESGHFEMPVGTDTLVSMFGMQPAASTGWTSQKGTSVLAVAKGVLTLQYAKGCATREYAAGQAAVVPAGKYRVINTGGEPLEFGGMFSVLAKGGKTPLVDDGLASAPAGCKDSAFKVASIASPELSEFLRATQVPIAAYGKSLHARTADKGIKIEAGKEVLIGSYRALKGFSSGWITHQPAFALVKSGVITYYEAIDGACAKSEEYFPGQAYTHVGGMHMGVVENSESAELIISYFNLPKGGYGSMMPVVGHQMDSINFFEFPPAECPLKTH